MHLMLQYTALDEHVVLARARLFVCKVDLQRTTLIQRQLALEHLFEVHA